MTEQNVKEMYKNFRNAQYNYEAREGLNSGLTATTYLRAKAGKDADALLKQFSYLKEPETKPKEVKKSGKE